MEILTKYRADDGREFLSQQQCERYERVAAAIDKALTVLGPKVGIGPGDWVQHEVEAVQVATDSTIAALSELYREAGIDKWIGVKVDRSCPSVFLTTLGRILDDGNAPRNYYRLSCTNIHSGREYEQPYFAINEHRADGREVQKRTV